MNRLLDSSWARALSLGSALALMILVTLFPRGLTVADGSPISHGALMLIMWGMSAGFVHGVGFVPHHRVLRVLLGPVAAWLWMGVGVVFYVRYFLR
jgi:predicted membrane protein